MFTGGVGALVDLPNFSVLVRGLDDWSYHASALDTIAEPRLLAALQALKRMRSVEQLRPAPWLDGIDTDPRGPAATVGVPVVPFPAWLRCTACDELAPVAGPAFTFENDKPARPHDARFFHGECGRPGAGRSPWRPASCWPASGGTSTTSRTGCSCTAGAAARRWSSPGCGWRTGAATSERTSRSGA